MIKISFILVIILNVHLGLSAQKAASALTLHQTVEVTLPNGKVMKNKVSFFINAGKAKSESDQNGMKMSIYYFDATKTMHTVVNMAGQIQKTETPDAINMVNSQFDDIQIEYLDETKTISGITCKKAIIKLGKEDEITNRVVWYDPDIILPFSYNFGVVGLELVKGLPLQYDNDQMGMKMVHEVQKVDTSTQISDEIFELPKNR